MKLASCWNLSASKPHYLKKEKKKKVRKQTASSVKRERKQICLRPQPPLPAASSPSSSFCLAPADAVNTVNTWCLLSAHIWSPSSLQSWKDCFFFFFLHLLTCLLPHNPLLHSLLWLKKNLGWGMARSEAGRIEEEEQKEKVWVSPLIPSLIKV